MSSLINQTWYCGSTKWSAVTAWAASASVSAGAMRRQSATPAVGSERVFVALTSGTTGGSEPTWGTTEGAKTTDNTVTWQDVTGKAAVNGDAASTSDYSSVVGTTPSLGLVIKNTAGTHYFIASTAGAIGAVSEPNWNTTTGAITTTGSTTWTCLGAVGAFSLWGAAAARLNVFLATGFFSSAGDRVLVNSAHAETQSTAVSYNGTSSGSAARRTPVVCVDDAGALATGASVTTTGASAINVGQHYYVYGLTFNAGTGANAASLTLGNPASPERQTGARPGEAPDQLPHRGRRHRPHCHRGQCRGHRCHPAGRRLRPGRVGRVRGRADGTGAPRGAAHPVRRRGHRRRPVPHLPALGRPAEGDPLMWWQSVAACAVVIWLFLAGFWLKGVVAEAAQAEVLREQIKANREAQDKLNAVARAAEATLAAERQKAAELNRKWRKTRDAENRAVCALDDDTLGVLREAARPAGVPAR